MLFYNIVACEENTNELMSVKESVYLIEISFHLHKRNFDFLVDLICDVLSKLFRLQ